MEKLKHSRTGNPYIMRKVVGIEENEFGLRATLECGHTKQIYRGVDERIISFGFYNLPEGIKKGCIECGKEEEFKLNIVKE